MTVAPHDFTTSFALAQRDNDLKSQLVAYLKSAQVSPPDKSDLVSSTADVMTWVIQEARSLYATKPERLVGAISSSTEANALAVWSRSERDWIVISEGLMEVIRDSVDDLGNRLIHAFPEIMETTLMRRLLEVPPLRGGFKTTLGSFLYFSAIAFFAGHEAGHHLAGHDGHYVKGAHAEHSADGGAAQDKQEWLTTQALERQADLIGLTLCRLSMIKLLSKLWEVERFSAQERQTYQRVLAILLGAGAMAAVLRITPREIDWAGLPGRQHPPAVVRALNLNASMSRSIKENFGDLDTASRKWIRLMCLELAVATTIRPGSPVDQIYQERLVRGGEPAAIRATGIRKALNDTRLYQYDAELNAATLAVGPKLKPRK